MRRDDRSGPGAETLEVLLQVATSRRRILKAGAGLAAVLAAPGHLFALARDARPLPGSTADRVIVADGYSHDVLIRWGDPLFPGGPGLDAAAVARGEMLKMSPADAELQFG